MQYLRCGDATASTATSVRDLRARLASLEAPSDPPVCRRCAAAKDPCSGTVLGASSMYEAVPADEVNEAGKTVVELLRRRGFRGVLVHHGPRLHGRMWRAPSAYHHGADMCSFEAMLLILRSSLAVCLARFGDLVFRQRSGLPIGGPPSDLGLGLLLSVREAAFRALPP